MLKTTPTSNPYCVPAALALLLDTTVDEACTLIKEELGDVGITGVFYPVILKKLAEHGYQWKELLVPRKLPATGNFLLCFKGHVGVWIDGTYYDNMNPQGVAKCLPKQRITGLYEVSR